MADLESNRVSGHYDDHLGPVYSWIAGGVENATLRGAAELDAIPVPPNGMAVDLGAGFGMHSLPLADRGYRVLAIDSCASLLEELSTHGGDRILTVCDDLLSFPRHLPEDFEATLVLCMGDTLTHLPDRPAVSRLISSSASILRPGGLLVLSFRDYSTELVGDRRFIPVRSDGDRILTCFLEDREDHILVHDLLHQRDSSSWKFEVGSYRKLRLSPEWVLAELEENGFSVRREAGLSGMVRLVATLC